MAPQGCLAALFRRRRGSGSNYQMAARCEEEAHGVMAPQECLAALFRRCRGSGSSYQMAARCEEEEDYEAVLFEEERLGEAELEARGDWFQARARKRSSWWYGSWSSDYLKEDLIVQDEKEAALSYVRANSWRKAAANYGERAIRYLKADAYRRDNEFRAAAMLLWSARCYKKISDKDDSEIAAIKLALETAIGLFNKRNDMECSAEACRELAEFYEEQQEWNKAVHYFEEANNHYEETNDLHRISYFSNKIRKIGCMVATAKLVQP